MCGNVYVIRLASKPQGCELAEGLRIPLQPKYLPTEHRPNDGFSHFPQKFVSNFYPVSPQVKVRKNLSKSASSVYSYVPKVSVTRYYRAGNDDDGDDYSDGGGYEGDDADDGGDGDDDKTVDRCNS